MQPPTLVPRLQEVLSRVRGEIILRHQEQQLNTAIEEEINIATRRRSSEIRAHQIAKEASYKDIYDINYVFFLSFSILVFSFISLDIVAQVIEKSMFLLKLRSVKQFSAKEQASNKDILTPVLKFIMIAGPIDDIKQLLLTKRSRY